MDCRHADLLMLFPARDLLPADRTALETHIRTCASCSTHFSQSQAADAAIRRSFAAVTIDGVAKLRTRTNLLALRAAIVRKRNATWAGTAAALLMVVGLSLGIRHQLRPTFDAGEMAYREQLVLVSPQQAVERWLSERRLPQPPFDLNYALYLSHGTQTVEGVEVPVLTFVRPVPAGDRVEFLKVYAVSRGDFHLGSVKDAQASLVTATVIRPTDLGGMLWVLLHTTPTVEPFLMPRGQG